MGRWSESDGGRRESWEPLVQPQHIGGLCVMVAQVPKAAVQMTRQSSLGTALPALEGEASRKGELTKAHPIHHLTVWPRAVDFHTSGAENKQLSTITTWNIRTMIDNDTSHRPYRRTAL